MGIGCHGDRQCSCGQGSKATQQAQQFLALSGGPMASTSACANSFNAAGQRAWRQVLSRRDCRLGDGRSSRNCVKRLADFQSDGCGAFDEHFWLAHHHAGLACVCLVSLGVAIFCATGKCAVSAFSGTPCRIGRRLACGHGLCRFLWLGLARTKNHFDAVCVHGSALARCALAMVWHLGFGLVGGERLGSLGLVASEFLVEFCGGGRLDPG